MRRATFPSRTTSLTLFYVAASSAELARWDGDAALRAEHAEILPPPSLLGGANDSACHACPTIMASTEQARRGAAKLAVST